MPEWTNDKGEQVELTEGELFILNWQKAMHGHFYTLLANALDCADMQNFARLMEGFPVEGRAMHEWKSGDLHKRLEAKGFSL